MHINAKMADNKTKDQCWFVFTSSSDVRCCNIVVNSISGDQWIYQAQKHKVRYIDSSIQKQSPGAVF